eukprot:UN25538
MDDNGYRKALLECQNSDKKTLINLTGSRKEYIEWDVVWKPGRADVFVNNKKEEKIACKSTLYLTPKPNARFEGARYSDTCTHAIVPPLAQNHLCCTLVAENEHKDMNFQILLYCTGLGKWTEHNVNQMKKQCQSLKPGDKINSNLLDHFQRSPCFMETYEYSNGVGFIRRSEKNCYQLVYENCLDVPIRVKLTVTKEKVVEELIPPKTRTCIREQEYYSGLSWRYWRRKFEESDNYWKFLWSSYTSLHSQGYGHVQKSDVKDILNHFSKLYPNRDVEQEWKEICTNKKTKQEHSWLRFWEYYQCFREEKFNLVQYIAICKKDIRNILIPIFHSHIPHRGDPIR